MRPVLRLVPALLLAALLALPAAHAHVENFSEAGSFPAGTRYDVFLDPRPAPLFTDTTVTLQAYVTDKQTGTFATDVRVFANVSMPDGGTKRVELKSDGDRSYLGGVVVTQPGEHNTTVTVTDSEGNHTGALAFEVYPNLPVRFAPADEAADQYTNVTTTMRFEVSNPRTGGPADLEDLSMRIEHWSDDHTTMYGSEVVPMNHEGGELWVVQHVFEQPGMYHLRFASDDGGFTYEDVPLLHMYAFQSDPVEEGANETPGLNLFVALCTVALVAVAARARK